VTARTFTSASEAATWYVEQGIYPVPVAYRGKKPKGKDWEQLRIDAASVPAHFNGNPSNIGALLGITATGAAGLTDVDLDSPESLILAPNFLPATDFVFGRASKPSSHWFFFCNPPVSGKKFSDPLNKSVLLELRGTKKNGTIGLQTVLPGSTHSSGELITFEDGRDSAPAVVTGDDCVDLEDAVSAIAAGALLARYWPASGRHDSMLALAGALARGGIPVAPALKFCRAVYATVPTHTPEGLARIESEIRDSFDKVAAGEPATGFPSLTTHIDGKVVETAFDWLRLKAQPAVAASIATAPDADWRKQLLVTDKGKITAQLENVLLVLKNESVWSGVLSYNEFNLCAITQKPAPWSQSRASGVWNDFDDSMLAAWLQRYGVAVNSRLAGEAAQTIAQLNPFHPVRDYLNSLVWDGKQRVSSWLPVYLGSENNAYTSAVGTCTLISGVARIFDPGCKVDQILLLEGPQGALKSTALRTLSGAEFFCDHISDIGSKDSRLELAGTWIFELSELDRVRRGELSRVKAFFTAQTDVFRPPYGRRTQRFPRTCIFCATTNDSSSLVDETGNRRWWPVKVGHIDIPALARDRGQIWAEAVTLYQAGGKWWLESPELNKIAAKEADLRYSPGLWDEEILNWCDCPVPREKRADDHEEFSLPFASSVGRVTISDILVHAVGKPFDKFSYSDQAQVTRCLTHDGWKRMPQCRVKDSTGYRDNRVRFWEKKL
jgi:Virulence-associated protein E/Bifunctional DNA primase/polymerase, N-terminal